MDTKKILIVGHARHGKDTVAERIQKFTGLKFESSSFASAKIFLYDILKEKYGYSSFYECFQDRINHRKEWHDLICEYNKDDKSRLAKEIMKNSDMYVGMRSKNEIDSCISQGIFDIVIGVYDPRKPLEDKSSFNIDIFDVSDFIICNNGSIEKLENNVRLACEMLI